MDKFLGLNQPKEPKVVIQPQQEMKLTKPQPKVPKLQPRVTQSNQTNWKNVNKKSNNSGKRVKDKNTRKDKSSAKNIKITVKEEITADKGDLKLNLSSGKKENNSVKKNLINTIGKQISDVKDLKKGGKNLKMRSKIVEEYSPEHSSDGNSNNDDSDDAISLSDDDLQEEQENSLKRKR